MEGPGLLDLAVPAIGSVPHTAGFGSGHAFLSFADLMCACACCIACLIRSFGPCPDWLMPPLQSIMLLHPISACLGFLVVVVLAMTKSDVLVLGTKLGYGHGRRVQ